MDPLRGTERNLTWLWFIVIFQSIGIRALPLQGVLLALLLAFWSFHLLDWRPQITNFGLVSGFTGILLVYGLVGDRSSIPAIACILLGAWAFSMLLLREGSRALDSLHRVLWWISFHGVLSYGLYLILPGLFSGWAIDFMPRQRFLAFMVVSFDGINRASGICWEPGVFQFVCILALILAVRSRRITWLVAVPLAGLVASKSTAGIFSLGPVLLYYLVANTRSLVSLATRVGVVAILLVALGSVLMGNVRDKLNEQNTSALVRKRDFLLGLELVKEHPLLGHGVVSSKELRGLPMVRAMEADLFSEDYLDLVGDMSGGFTSGFFYVLASYGLVIGGALFFLYQGGMASLGGGLFSLTVLFSTLLTMQSEPIAHTLWFFVPVMRKLVGFGIPRVDENNEST